MGNWVFNPWAVTYGDIWLDTRFHNLDKPVIPRITIDHFAAKNYYPETGKPSGVCYGKSTIYNIPKVEEWLKKEPPNHCYEHRPLYMQLRREIFESGKSEECHGKKYDDWRKYQECTIRRNMRMEYMIPKYPLHQINTYYEITEEP
ncbi:uncharacterized protein LOC111519207 isoform X2 [Drosophila willistoni]|nr:uncharacterized protein LOC111519207 isoform X2 [Drosophila willistoni]